MKPYVAQLAQSISKDQIADYLYDDRYWFEQKLDGQRLGIVVTDGNVEGWNRRGNRVMLSSALTRPFKNFNGRWVFDGEEVAGVFWVFDLIEAVDKISVNSQYHKRRDVLEAIATNVLEPASPAIRLLSTKRTTPEKAELTLECINNNSEGIMIKDSCGFVYPGKRSTSILKAKFWESADVIVSEVGREGKQSIAVEVYDNGERVNIGSCTVTPKMLTLLQENDVVELKYLYVGAGGRLYQPSFLRIRKDKTPEECTTEQLKYVNKTVLPISTNN